MTTSIGDTFTKPPKEGDLWYKPLTNQMHVFVSGHWVEVKKQKMKSTSSPGFFLLESQTVPSENGIYQLVPDPLTHSASFQKVTPVKDNESEDWD